MAVLPPVGFLGLGIMGTPMARHLAAAGYPVTVYNRTPARAEAARASFGARAAVSPKTAAEGARYVITMLTDAPAIDALMTGPDGFLAASNADAVWIQMSTIDVDSTRRFAEAARRKGWRFLDCPVTGSKKQVEAAQLILLAGGEAGLIDEAEPLLLKVGKTIVRAGDVGAGTSLKLCMNLIVAQMTTALAEATALAERLGVAPAKIFEVIKNSPALDSGYFRIKEGALLNRDFAPAFSLANMLKDVRFMNNEAGRRGLALPVNQAVQSLMETAAAEGRGGQDLSSILLTLLADAKTPS